MATTVLDLLHRQEIVAGGNRSRPLEPDTPHPVRLLPTCLKAARQPHFAEVEPDLPQSAFAVVLEESAFSSNRREDEGPSVLAAGAQLCLSDHAPVAINKSYHLTLLNRGNAAWVPRSFHAGTHLRVSDPDHQAEATTVAAAPRTAACAVQRNSAGVVGGVTALAANSGCETMAPVTSITVRNPRNRHAGSVKPFASRTGIEF